MRYPSKLVGQVKSIAGGLGFSFKTFNSDIDKISSKRGMFGRLFNDIGTAIHNKIIPLNEEFEQTVKIISSWKNSDSIWTKLYPRKKNIESQLQDHFSLVPLQTQL